MSHLDAARQRLASLRATDAPRPATGREISEESEETPGTHAENDPATKSPPPPEPARYLHQRKLGGLYVTLAEEALLAWFDQAADLPATSFTLESGERVVDPERFYAALRGELAQGPASRVWTRAMRQLYDLATAVADQAEEG